MCMEGDAGDGKAPITSVYIAVTSIYIAVLFLSRFFTIECIV